MIVNIPTSTLVMGTASMALYAGVAVHAFTLARRIPFTADQANPSTLASAPSYSAYCAHWQGSTLALTLAWVLHAAVLGQMLLVPPRFGFALALSLTALLAVLLYVAESHVYPPLRQVRWALAALSAGTLPLVGCFAGVPLPPGSSGWLSLHLALGMASYGLFALAVLHAWLMARAERRLRTQNLLTIQVQDAATMPAAGTLGMVDMPLLTLERLTFHFVQAGLVLLTVMMAQGVLLYDQLAGTDGTGAGMAHKLVFAALSWLVFAVLMLGRWRQGWRGQRAVRMVYAGAVCLLLSYIGTQFVLQVLLHRMA